MTTTSSPTTAGSARPTRARHWRRWLLIGAVVTVGIVYAGIAAFVNGAEPPLALPAAATSPAGPLDGTWTVAPGSLAGFRIRQTVLGLSGDVDGRTSQVTGSVTVDGGRVTAASFDVVLASIRSNGREVPQLTLSLETAVHPIATARLSGSIGLPAGFASGATVGLTAPAELTLRGQGHPVTVSLRARRAGTTIQLAGSIPVDFADFGIHGPEGFGPLGSLADRATAEFLLVLEHR